MQGSELREFLDKPSEQSSSALSALKKLGSGLRAQDVFENNFFRQGKALKKIIYQAVRKPNCSICILEQSLSSF